MKILITGGVGFIGTNCALQFGSQGHKITIVDNFSRSGVETNADFLKSQLSQSGQLKIIKQDVQQADSYLPQLKSADLIVHLAGQTAVTSSIQDPAHDFTNNLRAGFKLLEAVRIHNQEATLIYASTNKVYGNLSHHQLKQDEQDRYWSATAPNGVDETERLNFISPYGCSKGAVDQYFLDYARIFDLKTVVFRQSCIYGPFQMGVEDQGWVAHFSKQILQQQPLTIYGDGHQVRDLLFVNDLIDAYAQAYIRIEQVAGQVFNLGGGKNNAYSLRQVIKMLTDLTGNQVEIKIDISRQGDQKFFVSDNTKAERMLDWQVETDFRQGLPQLVDWQRDFLGI